MTTLREAAQMALDALEHGLPIIEDFGGKEQIQIQHKAIAALYDAPRAALAQPEPEPVAWMEIEKYIDEDNLWDSRKILRDYDNGLGEPLYTAPPQREVYCGCGDEIVAGDGARCGTCVAVKYKEKEWAGLTKTEFNEVTHNLEDLEDCWIAIEAKLKEKNT